MPFRNKEADRNYKTLWAQQRRQECVDYLGGVCMECGTPNNLHFHHRNPKDKIDNISRMVSRRWEILRRELDKCDLLCESCHIRRKNSAFNEMYNQWKRERR